MSYEIGGAMIYDHEPPILKYLIALIFLIDFKLTWRFTVTGLRGDRAVNASPIMAMIGKFIGLFIKHG